ncbi:uncharacterized protein LOC106866448 isoform X2 [Brachypodium distachyon]|uniref:uncharacterized protein LOC106866448 isoform X2 n=1 Tax=Brachypodium distachyon TaxID=15368 RepID=UPI00071E61ED|nr:uncharacterized protein LOC106866448 isoform X2 [Brachypodium distachyon]|eukprot:XP_014756169.1 uncharacterized protein LOC106866448 isoform X2 [Brachypodium distachyon]
MIPKHFFLLLPPSPRVSLPRYHHRRGHAAVAPATAAAHRSLGLSCPAPTRTPLPLSPTANAAHSLPSHGAALQGRHLRLRWPRCMDGPSPTRSSPAGDAMDTGSPLPHFHHRRRRKLASSTCIPHRLHCGASVVGREPTRTRVASAPAKRSRNSEFIHASSPRPQQLLRSFRARPRRPPCPPALPCSDPSAFLLAGQNRCVSEIFHLTI